MTNVIEMPTAGVAAIILDFDNASRAWTLTATYFPQLPGFDERFDNFEQAWTRGLLKAALHEIAYLITPAAFIGWLGKRPDFRVRRHVHGPAKRRGQP